MKYRIPPWEHQRIAIEKAKPLNNFALFFEQGTGKTGAVIAMLREKYEKHGGILKTLILAPPITLLNWKREFGLHSFIKSDEIVILNKSQTLRVHSFLHSSAKIFITNYESLLMKNLFAKLLEWGIQCLVCDESHKCKGIQSQRTKRAIELSDTARYKYILSGTPILNSPMDIFSQFRILDGGERFSKNFYQFRATYFRDANASMPRHVYFPNWKVKPGATQLISQKISEIGMEIKKEKCLDLPPLVRQEVLVEMSDKQTLVYEQMSKDFVSYLGDKACVAQIALTKMLRLQEIVSGFVHFDDGTFFDFEKNPRIDALSEILEVTGSSKVIIWACFRRNYQQIRAACDKLGVKYVEVHGDISNSDKQANVDKFNTDDSIKAFIGHPGSSGIGINLVPASYSIFYSRNFSLEQDLQAEARNYRGGSEIHEKVTRIDLVCPNTVDELVLKKLAMKEKIGEDILQAFKGQHGYGY